MVAAMSTKRMPRFWPAVACYAIAFLCHCGTVGSSSTKCKPRVYTHVAMQTDANGRRCWGKVDSLSCWGYCLTYEISDWQFPYKESHHPVCVHGERRHASALLSTCDPGVTPGTEVYHYVEAHNCKCQICSSEDTSCEWLPPDSPVFEGFLKKGELEDDIPELPPKIF